MLRIQPQSIIAESADHYLVQFERDNVPLEYTFSVEWSGEIGVLNCEQREFYFDTHDDPDSKYLLKAIDLFDEILRRETGSKLKSMSAVQDMENSYDIVFQTADRETVYIVECKPAPTLVRTNDPSKANSDRVLELVANFHQARHSDDHKISVRTRSDKIET